MNDTHRCTIPRFEKSDRIYLLILLLAALFFNHDIIFGAAIPLDEDSLLFFYPLRAQHSDVQMGYWDPYLFCGFPRDANPQSQLLYFPNWIFNLFPLSSGFALILFGHYILGGVFVYLLLRGLRLSKEAACFGAVVFLSCTFWRCKITNLGLLEGISWVPAVLYYYLLGLHTGKWISRLVAALALAMVILAGVPHTVFYTVILLTLVSFAYGLPHGQSLFIPLFSLVFTIIVSVLLSAGAWFPALLYMPETARTHLDLSEALIGSLHWNEIWRAFLGGLSQPGISRCDPWEGTCYLGATALLFVPSGWKALPSRLRMGLTLAIIFSVLCTLGQSGYIYEILYRYLPGWNVLNLPNRSLMLAAVVLPVFSAFGFERWLNRDSVSGWRIRLLYALAFVPLTIFGIAAAIHPGLWKATIHSALTQTFHPDSISDAWWAILNFSLWAGLTGVILCTHALKRLNARVSVTLLTILVILQSAQYSQRLFLETTSPDYFITPRTVRTIQERSPETMTYRVCGYASMLDTGSDVRMRLIRPILMHRLPEYYRLREIQGYDPMFPKRYAELVRAWAGQSPITDRTRTVRLQRLPKRLLDFLGVHYVIGHPGQEMLFAGTGGELRGAGHLESRLETPKTVDAVTFRWLLAGCENLPQGAKAAQVQIHNASGVLETFPVRAGIEIANYIMDYPGLKNKHKPAKEFRWFPIPSPEGTTRIHQYTHTFNLNAPLEINKISLDYFLPYGTFVLQQIDIHNADRQGLVPLEGRAEFPIYENPSAFPSAYFTRKVRHYEHVETIVNDLSTLPPGEEFPVFILNDDPVSFESSPVAVKSDPENTLTFQRSHSDRFEIELQSKYDGILAINENYSPNWQASIDGQQVEIVRANHSFMAVPIDAGTHTITFHYRPRHFYIALAVSAPLLCAILLLMIFYPRTWLPVQRKRRETL